MILLEEAIYFMKDPFTPKVIATGGLFHMYEVSYKRSQNAIVFKVLIHKTLLLFEYKNRQQHMELEERTFSVRSGLFEDISSLCLF